MNDINYLVPGDISASMIDGHIVVVWKIDKSVKRGTWQTNMNKITLIEANGGYDKVVHNYSYQYYFSLGGYQLRRLKE